MKPDTAYSKTRCKRQKGASSDPVRDRKGIHFQHYLGPQLDYINDAVD